MKHLLKYLFCYLIVTPCLCKAAIAVKNAVLEKSLEADEESALYEFSISNTGQAELTIEAIRPNCPCVEIIDAPKMLAAGEDAVIQAHFKPNPIGGMQAQQIIVQVKGETTPLILELVAKLPVLAEINPPYLFWMKGGEAQMQSAILKIPADSKAKVHDIYAMDENFQTKIHQEADGSRRIEVRPVNTAITRPVMVMIELNVEGKMEPLRMVLPCHIADQNPFEFRFEDRVGERKPDLKQLQQRIETSPAFPKSEIQQAQESLPKIETSPAKK